MGGKATKAVSELGLDLEESALTVQQVRRVWELFDKDGSGSLDKREGDAFFTAWLKSQGVKGKDELAQKREALWRLYDVDGDGAITFEEITGVARQKLELAEERKAWLAPAHEVLLDSEQQPETMGGAFNRRPCPTLAVAGDVAVMGAGGGICVYSLGGGDGDGAAAAAAGSEKPAAALSEYQQGCRAVGQQTSHVVISPDGAHAASFAGSSEPHCFVWKARGAEAGAKPLCEVDFGGKRTLMSKVDDMAFSGDGSRLLVSNGTILYVVDVATGKTQYEVDLDETLRGTLYARFAGPKGEYIVTTGEWSDKFEVRKSSDGEIMHVFTIEDAGEEGIHEMLVSTANPNILYTAHRTNHARAWDVSKAGSEPLWTADLGNWPRNLVEIKEGSIACTADTFYITPPGAEDEEVCFHVTVIDDAGKVTLTLNKEGTKNHHVGGIGGISYDDATKTFATVAKDGRVNLWDAATGDLKNTYCAFPGSWNILHGVPSARAVVATGGDSGWGIRVFDFGKK